LALGGRLKFQFRVMPVVLAGACVAAFSLGMAALVPTDAFGKMQLLAWATFAHYPLFLAGVAAHGVRRRHGLAYGSAALAACLVLIGVDAFLIEPRWLQVTRRALPSSKLQTPVRVVVIADLQTDAPGRYEEEALRAAMQAKPDLLLLAGDYVHASGRDQYAAASAALNEMLRRADLQAPLGVYAIRGNVDWPDQWRAIFAGVPVTLLETTSSLDVGPLVLTALSLQDAANTALVVNARDEFQLVLGHTPNFSLGRIEADLMIAGHTHGGQVQLPFVGPLMTLSAVPRAWASGLTEVAPGKTLIVSRGIGMERRNAPRLRFLCRPELVIVDLAPPP
jgi:hypothetical protein